MEPPMIEDYDWNRLDGLGFAEGTRKKLKQIQSKHSEGDVATAEMTPNYLPKEPGKGDEKNPQMAEGGVPIRMPRMEEIQKAANKNGQLAMHASANYAESMDFSAFDSDEANGAMIITQLRAMREKIDIMLGMLYPDDNLEPWCAVKITNAGTGLASVADYLTYGTET